MLAWFLHQMFTLPSNFPSTFSVVQNSPEHEAVMEKQGPKEKLMYLITNDLHQALVELANSSEF